MAKINFPSNTRTGTNWCLTIKSSEIDLKRAKSTASTVRSNSGYKPMYFNVESSRESGDEGLGAPFSGNGFMDVTVLFCEQKR